MEVDWKDFALLYLIGMAMALVVSIIGALLVGWFVAPALHMPLWVIYLDLILSIALIFGLPLAYYLHKNESDIVEAAAISFLYGATFPIAYLLLLIPYRLLQGMIFEQPGAHMLLPGLDMVDWGALLLELIILGAVASATGIVLNLILGKLSSAKRPSGKE